MALCTSRHSSSLLQRNGRRRRTSSVDRPRRSLLISSTSEIEDCSSDEMGTPKLMEPPTALKVTSPPTLSSTKVLECKLQTVKLLTYNGQNRRNSAPILVPVGVDDESKCESDYDNDILDLPTRSVPEHRLKLQPLYTSKGGATNPSNQGGAEIQDNWIPSILGCTLAVVAMALDMNGII
ncbi:expressed unknown protein [Seminavis robusta]|uniref:Uncharacterized protein n=1 Tax=Seminavis robusta TaxID=568900 RepID=A0A9N8HAY3_9STRA|nr:expressed unknown protein [Seminavis robusta]|eukprot:Sro339_g120990.1 n/a (180) ;mRNA; f:12618-13157